MDFPTHMKTIHQEFLDQTGTDTISSSMVDAMNAALGSSPYGSMTAHDPATELTAMDTAVAAFNTRVDAIDPDGDWEDAVDAAVAKIDGAVVDTPYIDNDIDAFGDIIDDQQNRHDAEHFRFKQTRECRKRYKMYDRAADALYGGPANG